MDEQKNNECNEKEHNCTQVLRKVFLVLDGELTHQEEKDFLADIEQCPHCLEKFNIEQSFKQFLINKLQRKNVSPALLTSIKEKIRQTSI